MSIPTSCDVVVIGGGPSGSTAASLLSDKGYEVVLLEKARHPRFTAGESLLPHAWRFFDLLGVAPVIEKENFVAKQGGTVVWDGHIRHLGFSDFGYERPGLNVERDRFDYLLLEHARKSGAQVFEETTVKEVTLSETDGPTVPYKDQKTGEEGSISCRFVVDASGQSALISRQLDMRIIDDDFRFVALWGYFEDSRYVAANGHAYPSAQVRDIPPTTFIASLGNWGWAWHIPRRNDTSVGLVVPLEVFKAAKKEEEKLESYYMRTLGEAPFFAQLLQDARYVEDSFHVVRDYSYFPGKLTGPGYFIVGDAAAFVDPIFSLGVVLAMYSGHTAAWAIDRSLRRPEHTESSQAMYANQFRGWYELARAMSAPSRPMSKPANKVASRYFGFQSPMEQDLLYAATMLTTREDNFDAIAFQSGSRERVMKKCVDLETIEF